MSQTKKRIQVSSGRLNISTTQQTIEMRGSSGTQGTRKPRGRSGCFLRNTITPAETRMNANSVPMLERAANQLTSKTPAGIPTANPATQVLICGVLYFGWTRENTLGTKRSRDLSNQIRAWPY